MKPDLYQTLGVARDAKSDEIRKAYYRAAKKAHPDGGGTVESFALVRTAVDVLSDEARRRQYDETGEFGDKPVDNSESLAMTVAMNAVDAVLGSIMKRGGDPAHYDVVADAKKHLQKCLVEIGVKTANTYDEAKAVRRLAKRFHAKKGKPNRIGAMLEARAPRRPSATLAKVASRRRTSRARCGFSTTTSLSGSISPTAVRRA